MSKVTPGTVLDTRCPVCGTKNCETHGQEDRSRMRDKHGDTNR